MPKVVITAQIEDAGKWESGFRTHADLFKSQTVNSPIHFKTDGNHVTIVFEPDDLDTYMKVLDSPATGEAMAIDGVIKETVKITVLDQAFHV